MTYHSKNVFPSWLMLFGGFLMCAITVPDDIYINFAINIMIIGDIIFIFLVPLILYRLIKYPLHNQHLQPIIAIIAAPASLALVSWLGSNHLWPEWGLITSTLDMILTLYIYIMLPKFLFLSFTPTKVALTFPLTISATAMWKMSEQINFFTTIAILETMIASLSVVAVCLQFFNFYILHKKSN